MSVRSLGLLVIVGLLGWVATPAVNAAGLVSWSYETTATLSSQEEITTDGGNVVFLQEWDTTDVPKNGGPALTGHCWTHGVWSAAKQWWQGGGVCVERDVDGDEIWLNWSELGSIGKLTARLGTGKYSGIEGEGKTAMVFWAGYLEVNKSYQVNKTLELLLP